MAEARDDAAEDISREPVRGWKLSQVVWAINAVNVRARMEYRADFAILVFYGVIFQVVALAFVWIVVSRFHGIQSWSLHEILFIVGIRLIAHGLWEPIFDNLPWVTEMVRDAWFDRILIRPMNSLLQVLTHTLLANGFGDLLLGCAVFWIGQRGIGIHWSPISISFLALVIAGGILLEAAFYLAIASLSFWVVRTQALAWWADDAINTFGNYPISVFPLGARFVFTFVFPTAFLSFFPATAILGRSSDAPFSPALAYGAPLIGLGFFVTAYRVWNMGLRHHQSTGT